MQETRSSIFVAVVTCVFNLAVGCASGPVAGPSSPLPLLAPVDQTSIDTDPAFGAPTGVARIDGRTLVLLERGGVHELGTSEFWRFNVGNLQDIVALDAHTLAATTANMGYLLHLETLEAEQHFCYVPEAGVREEEPPPVPDVETGDLAPTFELARGVTVDSSRGLIYAQPQTVVSEDRSPIFSEIATFDLESGQELEFQPLPQEAFAATALAMLDGDQLVAGQGSRLFHLDIETGDVTPLAELEGVASIDGLARDPVDDTLTVVDAVQRRVFTFDLMEAEATLP